MRLHILKIFVFITLLAGMISCSYDPVVDFGEQYKKTVYIVNSRGMLYTENHYYGSEQNYLDISVYCASSEPIKADFSVTLKIDPVALDSLNLLNSLGNPLYVNKIMLPENHYTFSEKSVTVKANSQYAVLRIPIVTDGLDPEITYTLPISIVSNSANYDINPELRTMVYELKMVNGFSGDYSGSSIELPSTSTGIKAVQPVLKAMSGNTVRMPIHNLSSELQDIDTNFMLLSIGNDSTSVAISPWKNAKVTDLGGSTFDRKKRSFTLNYSFEDSNGKTLTIMEKITDMNSPDLEDDETE